MSKSFSWEFPTAFSYWGDEEMEAIARVIASERFTMGAEVEAFEHEFAVWHGRKHGIMVNSGSSANLVAVAALFNKRDNPLQWPKPEWVRAGSFEQPRWHAPMVAVVPAIAWSTTYAPLVQHGLDLVLADVDDTWNAPVPSWYFRAATKVIVGCSILGNPGYMQEWQAEADKIGAYFIEDNCESFGAAGDWGNGRRRCGSFGDMSTFSFFYSHQISAIEGGMILTDDDEMAQLCRVLRAHGWTRDIRAPANFSDEYNFVAMGYNVRPLEMHAAIAREQLKKLPQFIEARLRNWDYFAGATYELPIKLPVSHGEVSPFGLPFECHSSNARRHLVRALRAEGIDCRLPSGGSFRQHRYGLLWADQKTPCADQIDRCGLFLGNAPWDISDKIDRAVGIMRNVLTQEKATSE